MSARWLLLAVLAVPAVFVACGETSEPAAKPDTTGELPCDIDAYFQTRCAECHGEKRTGGAPMTLVHRSDFFAPAPSDPSKTVADLVPVRLRDDKKPMPEPGFVGRPRATAAELDLVEKWIAAKMPKRAPGEVCSSGAAGAAGAGGSGGGSAGSSAAGASGTSGEGGAGGATPVETCTPIALAPEGKWTMPKATVDEYVCFGVEVPNDHKRHITSITPKVDNTKIVHHLLVFESKELIPLTPHKCKQQLDPTWKLLYAWGPGTQPYTLPKEAGFPMGEPAEEGGGAETSRFIVQVHYSNIPHDDGETDASSIELCATDQLRPNDADLVALGGVSFKIPAHGSLETSCDSKIPGPTGADPMVVFQTWPHMHKLGTKLKTIVTHEDGSEEELVKVDNYSFENQLVYSRYPDTMTLKYGDSLRTTCTWSNPTDKSVGWGEDTLDEMCFNFITYYPKRNDYRWNGLAPSYFATCSSKTP